jgi:hypothetical protein
MPSTPRPATAFDWAVYGNATLAGLSVLIPIPFLDSAFEWFFSRQILPSLITRRGYQPSLPALVELEKDGRPWYAGCVFWPVSFTWSLLKRLSKKILYFLTVKEATDKLSYYWHRAFLLDYMLQLGHLDDPNAASLGRMALTHTLNTAGISPLTQLARQTAAAPGHIFRSLRRARRGQVDAELQAKRNLISQAWDGFGDYLDGLAERYDRAYAQALQTRLAQAAQGERPPVA